MYSELPVEVKKIFVSLFLIPLTIGIFVSCGNDNAHLSSSSQDLLNQKFHVQNVPLAVGYYHSCAIDKSGVVYCWGRDTLGRTSPPSDLMDAAFVTVSKEQSAAIRKDGTPVFWGPSASDLTMAMPKDLGPIRALAIGEGVGCAIVADETVRCWGPVDEKNNPLLLVPGQLGKVKQLSIYPNLACALKTDQTFQCWGSPELDQTTAVHLASEVHSPRLLTVGIGFSIVVDTSGHIHKLGQSANAQLVFDRIPEDLSSYSFLKAGHSHACGMTFDHKVKCWGFRACNRLDVPSVIAE
jgi:hypothetical protein